MKGLPLLASNRLTPLVEWLHSFVSSARSHFVRFVTSHPLQPLIPLSPPAMALGGAGEHGLLLVKLQVHIWLPPKAFSLLSLGYKSGSLFLLLTCLEVQCKGQLCWLQPLPGIPAWELWALDALMCAGSATSSTGTSIAGHELISTIPHTAV